MIWILCVVKYGPCSKVINTSIHSSVLKILFVTFVGLEIWFSIRTEARLSLYFLPKTLISQRHAFKIHLFSAG